MGNVSGSRFFMSMFRSGARTVNPFVGRDSALSITRHGRPVSHRIFLMTTSSLYGGAERRMRMIENRLKHIAGELAFRTWFRRRRILETMTADELETYAVTGQWLDRPEPAVGNESASTRWTGQVS